MEGIKGRSAQGVRNTGLRREDLSLGGVYTRKYNKIDKSFFLLMAPTKKWRNVT